eukprot:COSAG01_NODE_30531_length_614_cov_0.893204_1_plen_111_part_00
MDRFQDENGRLTIELAAGGHHAAQLPHTAAAAARALGAPLRDHPLQRALVMADDGPRAQHLVRDRWLAVAPAPHLLVRSYLKQPLRKPQSVPDDCWGTDALEMVRQHERN